MSDNTNNNKGTELDDRELNNVNGGLRLEKSSSQMKVIDEQLKENNIRKSHPDNKRIARTGNSDAGLNIR